MLQLTENKQRRPVRIAKNDDLMKVVVLSEQREPKDLRCSRNYRTAKAVVLRESAPCFASGRGGNMKTVALFGALLVLLLLSTISWAAPTPDEYSIDVHVSSSRWVMEPGLGGPWAYQKLNATIDGKKCELKALVAASTLKAGVPVLALGAYKAKLVTDGHKTTYESVQVYEFLLPDKKTRKFTVVGISE